MLLGALIAPMLAFAGVLGGLLVSTRNADRQAGTTVLKIGQDTLVEANVTLLRERDEARGEVRTLRAELVEKDRENGRLRSQLLEHGITPRGRQTDG